LKCWRCCSERRLLLHTGNLPSSICADAAQFRPVDHSGPRQGRDVEHSYPAWKADAVKALQARPCFGFFECSERGRGFAERHGGYRRKFRSGLHAGCGGGIGDAASHAASEVTGWRRVSQQTARPVPQQGDFGEGGASRLAWAAGNAVIMWRVAHNARAGGGPRACGRLKDV
jgi:hypothetical protein